MNEKDMTSMDKNAPEELKRFRPKTEENKKIRVTRFLDLCKSCGMCVQKCPVNAISWDEKDLGMLGEPGIYIDLDKCIGCEMCERVCPDNAISITNKRLSAPRWQKGILGWIVRNNVYLFEKLAFHFHAPASRQKKVGKSKRMTLYARFLRTFLGYNKTPIEKQYEE